MALLAAAWAAWAAWTSKLRTQIASSGSTQLQKAPQRCGAFLLCRASRATECRLRTGAISFALLFFCELFDIALLAGFFKREVFASGQNSSPIFWSFSVKRFGYGVLQLNHSLCSVSMDVNQHVSLSIIKVR
jgi:hypothetical protein